VFADSRHCRAPHAQYGHLDYFKERPDTSHWKSVPLAAQKRFPSVDVILKQRTVSRNPMVPLRLAPVAS
jgi:hypothetical protein